MAKMICKDCNGFGYNIDAKYTGHSNCARCNGYGYLDDLVHINHSPIDPVVKNVTIWEIGEAWNAEMKDRFLNAGWEPFAVADHIMHFRRIKEMK